MNTYEVKFFFSKDMEQFVITKVSGKSLLTATAGYIKSQQKNFRTIFGYIQL